MIKIRILIIMFSTLLMERNTVALTSEEEQKIWQKDVERVSLISVQLEKCKKQFSGLKKNAQEIPNNILAEIELNYTLLPTLPTFYSDMEDLIKLSEKKLGPLFADELNELREHGVQFGTGDPKASYAAAPFHSSYDEIICYSSSKYGAYDVLRKTLVLCITQGVPLSYYYNALKHESLHAYQFLNMNTNIEKSLTFPVSSEQNYRSSLIKFTIDSSLSNEILSKLRAIKGTVSKFQVDLLEGTCMNVLGTYCTEMQAYGLTLWENFLLNYYSKKIGMDEACYMYGPFSEEAAISTHKNMETVDKKSEITALFREYGRLMDEKRFDELDRAIIKTTASELNRKYLNTYKNIGKLGPLRPELCNSNIPDMKILKSSCE